MLTQYKRKDLKELTEGNHDLYNQFSLIGDKLRTIYIALGWTHMTKDFGKSDSIVEELTGDVLQSLIGSKDTVTIGSAGLEVCGYFDDDDMLYLDYNFKII